MFIIIALISTVVAGKTVLLFADDNLNATSSWVSDCAAKDNVALLNATTKWRNIAPYDAAISSYSLITAACTISNSAPTMQYSILNDCILTLQSASTDPSVFIGEVQWQGKSVDITAPSNIYSNASAEAVFVEWTVNLGSFTADNDTFVVAFTVDTLARTQWLVTNYLQVQCTEPWNTTENLVIIVSCAVGFMILVLSLVIISVRRCILKERYYFSLNKNRKRCCKCCRRNVVN
jgi:hypothetical protein